MMKLGDSQLEKDSRIGDCWRNMLFFEFWFEKKQIKHFSDTFDKFSHFKYSKQSFCSGPNLKIRTKFVDNVLNGSSDSFKAVKI